MISQTTIAAHPLFVLIAAYIALLASAWLFLPKPKAAPKWKRVTGPIPKPTNHRQVLHTYWPEVEKWNFYGYINPNRSKQAIKVVPSFKEEPNKLDWEDRDQFEDIKFMIDAKVLYIITQLPEVPHLSAHDKSLPE